MKVCPNCRGNNLDDWPKCAKCGKTFIMPAPPSPTPAPTPPSPDRTTGENEPTQIILPKSTEPTRSIPSRLTACAACGHAMGKTAKECPQCGEQAQWVKAWYAAQAAQKADREARFNYADQVVFILMLVFGIVFVLWFIYLAHP